MPPPSRRSHESLEIGAMPILNRFLERLGLEKQFERALPEPDGRSKMNPAAVLTFLIRNILVASHPLYKLQEWADKFVPDDLGLDAEQVALLNDDRVGRCLDLLWRSNKAALITSFIAGMVDEFDLDLDALHNDSTTITFSGRYLSASTRSSEGGPLCITWGHNKDFRPDLKQLVYELTVTEDGGVPILANVHDGNTSDSTTHLPTWKKLRQIVGHAHFMYVADSKLCDTETMSYIFGQGGRLVTILPATRKEERWFKEWIQDHVVDWQEIARIPSKRRRGDPPDIIRAVDSPKPSAEGLRIVWYHSSVKHGLDQKSRQEKIDRAVAELELLRPRLGAYRLKTTDQVEQAAKKLLEHRGAEAWVEIGVGSEDEISYRQVQIGRPGKNTRYASLKNAKPTLTWKILQGAIEHDAKTDGLFPLITTEKDASQLQILEWYKYQPRLEKRFEQLKTVMEVRPVFLKNVQRIEAYLLIFYLGLTVHALIERQLRQKMRALKITELPLYPEKRRCKAPTAERVLELYSGLRRHRIMQGKSEIERYYDELPPLQRKVLNLLGVSHIAYTQ